MPDSKPLSIWGTRNPNRMWPLCPATRGITATPRRRCGTDAVARLVVEGADTSFDYDRTVKAELYAEAGVADYWILDLNGRSLLVLRDPAPVAAGGFAYHSHRTLGEAESVAPLAAPAAAVRVADLLP